MRVALLLLAGCGRLAFGPQGDAAGDAMAPDAPPDATCTWSAFSKPAALPGPVESAADDWCPTPTAGGLQIFMHTYRTSSFAQLWFATRASTSDAFGAASNVTELTTGTSQQFDPTLTDDGLHIIYSDSKAGGFDLFEAVRTAPTAQFGAPVALASLNDPIGTDWNAFVSSDGLRLMYTSNRGAGNDQIYEATRSSLGAAFAAPTLHGELTIAGTNQWSPTLTADWLDIYFSSTRTGGPGGYDVYTAHRAALDQAFGAATLVPELSSAMDDVCLRLIPEGTTVYLNYDAITSGGNADLDVATRTCN